jgi:hypothetical protein
MADFSVSEVALEGVGATQTGRAVKVTNCDKVLMTIVITTSAINLVGTLTLTGTNDADRALDTSVALPVLTGGTAITALPSGITFASNAVTFATGAAATAEITVAYSAFTRFVRPVFTFTSGGGTISNKVTISGWST